jgi:hypothetical protein
MKCGVLLVLLLCADPPPICSGLPTKPDYGSWPSSCANIFAGQTCSGVCSYGGSVSVSCQAGGTWSSTYVGACQRESQLWHCYSRIDEKGTTWA